MSGLRVINRLGGAPSSDEIQTANRVASMYREKRIGTIRYEDPSNGVIVEYHPFKNIAYTEGGIKYFYNGNTIPDIPQRTLHYARIYNEFPDLDAVGYSANYQIKVYMSDGEILGTMEGNVVVVDNPSGGDYDEFTNYIEDLQVWVGESYVIVEEIRIISVIFPPVGSYPPNVNTGTNRIEFEIPVDTAYPDVDYNGDPITLSPEAEASNKLRVRNYYKSLSDQTIESLEAGNVEGHLVESIKTNHPVTLMAAMPKLMTVTATDTIVSQGSSATYGFKLIRRTVELSYLNLDDELVEETATGTLLLETFGMVLDSFSIVDTVNYKETYTNFPAFNQSGIVDLSANTDYLFKFPTDAFDPEPAYYPRYSDPEKIAELFDNALYLDSPRNILAPILNGIVEFSYAPESPFYGYQLFGNQEGVPYSPPPSLPIDTVSAIDLPFLIQYRELYKPIFTESDNSTFLDSSLTDGEVITIYPIEYIYQNNDDENEFNNRGLYTATFPGSPDETRVKIRLTKGYKYRYKYSDGTYTFLGTKSIVDKTLEEPEAVESIELDLPTDNSEQLARFNFNFVLMSDRSKTPWSDVNETYTEQKDEITDEFNPEALTVEGLYDFLS